MTIKSVNQVTGEEIEVEVNGLGQAVEAWQLAQAYEKLGADIRDQLKMLVTQLTSNGTSEVHNGYMFRQSFIQRRTYDKAVMRRVFDEDVVDLLLKPDKSAVDKYLKENLESLGEASTELRQAMVDDGRPYQVIKLERVDRDVAH